MTDTCRNTGTTAYKSVTVQNPSQSATNYNQLWLTEQGASTNGEIGYTRVTRYTYTAPGQWDMQQGPDTNTVLRDELHTDLWDATYTYRTNTDLIRDGASNVVAQTVE